MNINEKLANIFDEMAVEFKKDRWRKKSYETAAEAIRRYPQPITSGTQAMKNIKGIGKGIADKIDEIIRTGELKVLTERPQEKIQKDKTLKIFEGIHGVGPVQAEKWYDMGYQTFESLAGLYNNMNAAQKLGYQYYYQLKERIPRTEIDEINKIISERWENIEYVIAGSYRRGEVSSGDIDILVKNTGGIVISELVGALKGLIVGTLASGPTKYMGIIKLDANHHARRLDIRLVDKTSWAYALLYFTGSKQLNVEMRAKAMSMGLTMNEYGMVGPGNKEYPANTEQDIFGYLNIPYLEPTERSVITKEKLQNNPSDVKTVQPSELTSSTTEQKVWHRPSQDFFIYITKNLVSTGNMACFDLDWTIAKPEYGKFPKSPDDIVLMENRKTVLLDLIVKGYTIVIFTNQKSTTNTKLKFNFDRINRFINLISDIPIMLFMSTADDIYRKPNTGMYQALQQMVPVIHTSFYCGDAAGRESDFSDSDKMFAKNNNIPFYLPEQIFGK